MCIRDRYQRRVHGELLMKALIITLGLLFALVAAQDDCKNPLLGRDEVKARFGADTILTTPRDASNLPICQNLNTKKVCVSDAGFTNLKTWFDNLKSNFQAEGQARTSNRYKGLVAAKDLLSDACMKKYIAYGLFTSAIMVSRLTGAKQPWDFGNFQTKFNAEWKNYTSGNKKENDDEKFSKAALGDAKGNVKKLATSKAQCAKGIFQHIIATSCLAASASYNTVVLGTSSSPKLKLSKKVCGTHTNQCIKYFDAVNAVETSFKVNAICTSTFAERVVSGFEATDNKTRDDTLNAVYTDWAKTENTTKSDTVKNVSPPNCREGKSTASDCNFVCQRILNATGANLTLIQSLDTSSSNSRLLQDSSIDTSSDTGFNPDEQAVGADATIAADSTPESAVSIQMGLISLFAVIIAAMI
eukprot:TRINITY_DN4716_c0_g1_i1.p1 TRINITY_DN4716_c0_g1~~TRINITY_DN4716_c0_g1_i1.p1  ORF type:complete len:415 (+),score=98.77 TRINITY_DN4716_c0_g1_i1:68-1312(+)